MKEEPSEEEVLLTYIEEPNVQHNSDDEGAIPNVPDEFSDDEPNVQHNLDDEGDAPEEEETIKLSLSPNSLFLRTEYDEEYVWPIPPINMDFGEFKELIRVKLLLLEKAEIEEKDNPKDEEEMRQRMAYYSNQLQIHALTFLKLQLEDNVVDLDESRSFFELDEAMTASIEEIQLMRKEDKYDFRVLDEALSFAQEARGYLEFLRRLYIAVGFPFKFKFKWFKDTYEYIDERDCL